MKGISGQMLWIILSLVILIAIIAIFIFAMPNITDSLTLFGAKVLDWVKTLF
jgi:hypothetical protein